MYLLVGDADNNILLYEKYSHSYLMENPTVFRFIDFQENSLRDIEAHFISEDWGKYRLPLSRFLKLRSSAGIDCTTKFENAPKEKGKGKKIVKKNQSDDTTYMQTFMEMYMKSKRNSDAKTPGEDFNNNEETYSSDKKKDVCNNSKIVIHGNVTIFDKNDSDDEETKRKRIVSTGKNAKCDGSVQCSLSALTASIPQDGFFASKAELDRSTVIGSQFFKQQCSSKRDDGVKRSPLKQVLLPSDVQLDRSIKKQFAFTPKKFSHCKSSLGESCANSTLSPSFENKPKTQKITWRSPLTYSPAVKFSPKLPYNRLTMSSTESDDHPSSLHSTPLNPEISKILNKTSSSTSETPSHSKTFFPLSDKAYEDSSLEEKADRTEEVLEKVGDFVSTQFLESYGLISPSTKTNTQIKSPNEYYHHLLTQTQSKEKMKEVKKEFDNNEKKRKRCANSESSDAGKRQETDKKRVDSREKTDATQSPYFSHSSKSEAKSTSSQDGPTKKVHIKKLIKPSKSQGHSSDRLMPSYSKYQKELNREEPAVVPERTSFGSYSASRGHSFGDEKDDPFNDSKQSALMQLALPPQSLQEDTRSRRNSSKTDSHNFDDYDDDEFFYDMDDDDLYDTLTYMDDRSRRSFATVNPIFKQYDDISADDDLSDGNGRSMPEYRNSRTSVGDDNLYRSRPHFVEYDTHRSNYFHPIDINAPSTSHYHPRYENHDHQYHKKPETITNPNYESDRSDRRRVSFRSDGYSNNSLTPYGRQSFRPPYYSFLPHEETSDFHQNKVSEEGYRYIRQMMEKENEPPPYQDRNANYHHAPQSISSALVEGSLNPNLPSSSSRDFVEESRFDFEGSRRERARTPFQERQEAARPEYHTPRSRPPLLVQPPSSPSFSNRNFVDDGHFERSSRGHLSTPFLEQLGLYRDHSTRDAETPRNTPRTRPRVLTERSINLNPGPSNRNFVDDDRFDFERRQLRTPFQEQVEPYPEYYGLEGDLPQRPQMPFYRGETSPPSRSSDRSYVMQKFFKHLK
ncbi:uncharacterized protein LOC135132674 isoform X1 [Zophobas morio]|uniref:uncharacterized protein LOC135132674 isoform X1 n=1 Tax=Zophobas morio TaxID=2755281 RepID=UPI003083D45D